MTIVFRNTTVTIGILIAFCLTVSVFLFSLFFLPNILQRTPNFSEILGENIFQVSNVLYLGFFSFAASLLFRIIFSKTLAPEMFFFTIFILTFSFEVPRILFLLFEYSNSPFNFSVIITRIVHFGRFLRVFSIFVAGLFACSISNPKTGVYLGIGILLSIAFAIGIPIDATQKTDALLYVMGLRSYTRILFSLGELLSIVNIVLAGILKNTREYYCMAVFLIVTIIGSNLLIIFPQRLLFLVIGIPIFTVGTILFGKQSHDLYLWK